jgi:NADH dehydrogenase FAD-containing subunit
MVAAFAVGAGATYSVALGMGLLEGEFAKDEKTRSLMVRKQLPSRKQLIQELKSGDFDVLVIGGGATGMEACFASGHENPTLIQTSDLMIQTSNLKKSSCKICLSQPVTLPLL